MGNFYFNVSVFIFQKLGLSLKYCHFCGKAIKQKASLRGSIKYCIFVSGLFAHFFVRSSRLKSPL